MTKITYLFLFLFFAISPFSADASSPIALEDYAADYSYFMTKLSPDAKHLAVGLIVDGKRRLAVFEMKSFKIIGGADFTGIEEVGDFYWANNKRLVIKVLQKQKWEEQPGYYGELFAVDYDGKNREMIYGYRAGESQGASRVKVNKAIRGWADVISTLPDDKKHILISSTPQSESGSKLASIHKLNVKSGKLSNAIVTSPVPYAHFVADKKGNVRIAVGTDKTFSNRVYHLEPGSTEWTEVDHQTVGGSFEALALDDSGKNLFIVDDSGQDKMGVFKMNLATGERKRIYIDDEVDITRVTYSADGHSVYAARTDADYPAYVMFNAKSEEAKIYKSLLGSFPGHAVTITSKSKDDKLWVVATSSDVSAGHYYLYDKPNNKLRLLFREMSHLKGDVLAKSRPIKFTASDGVDVRGYITDPIGVDKNENAPLVVLVHGGPHGVRDYWSFDREVQLLAGQGYAVLRVNYRGSAGYGNEFSLSGYKHWGDTVQQDIIDGTRYAMSQEGIDGDRVCIMGGSFGGYSAVQSATLAPDLYKCVVANAGVYDLEMMFTEGDIPGRLWGDSYLKSAVGTDIEKIRAFSPVNNVDKLKAPVLIAHGKKDRRVPYVQAKALRKVLDKQNKSYEWFIKKSEAHGFNDEGNRAEYYEKVSKFLEQHL